MHESVGRRVELQRLSELNRALQTRPQQPLARGLLAKRQHADRNLRAIAEQRLSDRSLARADHLDDVATVGIDIDHVSAINPRMSAAHSLLSTRVDHDRRHNAQCSMLNAPKGKCPPLSIAHSALSLEH